MSAPIPLEDAWARLLALAAPLETESCEVDSCHGRYLAADLNALRDQPARDLSAMDGFAICGPGPWEVIGESRAGHDFDGALAQGQAVRISTGAACPAGTDAILIQEDARVLGTTLAASATPAPGQHIRCKGFDFARDAGLLAAGSRIGPAQIALARAAGHAVLTVGKRPKVAIIECGDELVADPRDCPPDRLPASNGAMVAAMAAACGAEVARLGPVADDADRLAEAFEAAGDADIMVTSGGASVGPHDLLRPTLLRVGAEIEFWKVAIRPGKPLLLGRKHRQLVLSLPGNPVSSYVTAFLFLLPLIRHLQAASGPLPRPITLPLNAPVGPVGDRREFLRATIDDHGVTPLAERDSSALASLGLAEALIDRPAGASAAKAGALVPCYLLTAPGNA